MCARRLAIPTHPRHPAACISDRPKQARAYLAQLRAQRIFQRPIVTKIESLRGFVPAETYHQDYMKKKNPNTEYIVANDRPKVEALKRLFPKSYRG